MKKEKKQFILLSWRDGEVDVKNISHLDEFSGQFDHLT
jgi:hypothetical protein